MYTSFASGVFCILYSVLHVVSFVWWSGPTPSMGPPPLPPSPLRHRDKGRGMGRGEGEPSSPIPPFPVGKKWLHFVPLATPLLPHPLKNAMRRQESEAGLVGRRHSAFLVASISSLLLQNSQKLRDFWPMLCRQYLPNCPPLHFHTMQQLRDG
jgi:hypothetical protein